MVTNMSEDIITLLKSLTLSPTDESEHVTYMSEVTSGAYKKCYKILTWPAVLLMNHEESGKLLNLSSTNSVLASGKNPWLLLPLQLKLHIHDSPQMSCMWKCLY